MKIIEAAAGYGVGVDDVELRKWDDLR